MDLSQLLALEAPEPPADFADFWRARHAVASLVEPQPRVEPTGRVLAGHAVYNLTYVSTGDVKISGWLLAPEGKRVTRGVVVGHGYGGHDGPEEPLDLEGTAWLYPCFRGLGRSRVKGLSANPALHVLHDIQDKNRYVIGGCVEDLWLAVSALLSLYPQISGRVAYMGISLGGGLGALATPWDTRIDHVFLHVPTFGHQSMRLTLPSIGSSESVRHFFRHHNFNVMETLAYYDAASAARFIQVPILVAAALFDPAVPPPGQFAIYNAIPDAWRHLFVLEAGHFDYPGKLARLEQLNRQLAGFLLDS